MNKNNCFITVGVLLANLWLAAQIQAVVLNFNFRGTITEVRDRTSLLDDSVVGGAPFEGYFTFDTSTPDDNPAPYIGDYFMARQTNILVVKAGNYVFRTHPTQGQLALEVYCYTSNFYTCQLSSYLSVCSHPLAIEELSLLLEDTTTPRDDDALPLVPPILAVPPIIGMGLSVSGGRGTEDFLIRGEIEAITNTPVAIEERPAAQLAEGLEVRWPSLLGCYYRVYYSPDEYSCDIADFQGDGAPLAHFLPKGAESCFAVETWLWPPDESADEVETVTVRFSGQLTEVHDDGFLMNETVPVGTPFEGVVVAEAGLPDEDDNPEVGFYNLNTLNCNLMVKVGDFLFTSDFEPGFWLSTGPASYEETNRLDWVVGSENILCREGLPAKALCVWLTSERLLSFIANYAGLLFSFEGVIEQAQFVPPLVAANPPVTLSEAVRLSWPSALGYFYRAQTSTNMVDWENLGEPVLGDGGTVTQFLPKAAETNWFYRVAIVNYPKAASRPAQR